MAPCWILGAPGRCGSIRHLMADELVLETKRLGFPWETVDPFLFCVHHDDAYPKGNETMGPAASLAGRKIGQDFEGKDGWRMYHGQTIPGFPQHPHRGFETVTIVRKGLIDHSDSLGATARFGAGDTQWLTAGKGIVHAEMFPLVDTAKANPLELFQIWLNLPASGKMVDPYFSMFWKETVPVHVAKDAAGKSTTVKVTAGRIGDAVPPRPPPDSWAARPESDVAIWTIHMEPGATFSLPPAKKGTNRTLYLYGGDSITAGTRTLQNGHLARLRADLEAPLVNANEPADLLLLQGRPIGEPVVSYGPFVMNTKAEIVQAFEDYRKTEFGGWPWKEDGPVHAREAGRFARRVGGREEHAGAKDKR